MFANKRLDNRTRPFKQNAREFAIVTGIFMGLIIGFGSIVPAFAGGPGTEVMARSKEGDFIRGARSWANNCFRCHNMRDPKELRDDQWKLVVSHMRIRAGLTGQQARDILKFLQEIEFGPLIAPGVTKRSIHSELRGFE
jgi:hypothetical protein